MEALPQDLADFLVTKNFDPEYFDKQGQPSEAGEATTIKFDYVADSGKNYGTAVCVISNDELSLYYGDNLGRGMEPEDKDEWYSFLEQLSNTAASHSATWTPTEINKLKHNLAGIAAIKEGLFEGYYGNRKVSYMGEQTQARLVINHNRVLGENDKRFRYVESLFIETADQERFRLPFKSLAGGRAMLEHVRSGGRPYDVRGNHITEVVSEMAVLSRFNRAQHHRVFEGVTQELVESAQQYYRNLQETVKHLGSPRGYQAYFESWAPDQTGEAEALVENLRDLLVEQTLDARIEAALPTLAKIQQQGNNMKEAQIFENWINNLSEGTWALPETPEQMEKLNQLMSSELIVGPDATNATEQLYDIVGDDELFDILNDLADKSQGRANCWDDSDVQRRLAELGIQTPQSTETEPADVPQDTAPPVAEGELDEQVMGDQMNMFQTFSNYIANGQDAKQAALTVAKDYGMKPEQVMLDLASFGKQSPQWIDTPELQNAVKTLQQLAAANQAFDPQIEESNELAEMLRYAGVPVKESVLTDSTGSTMNHIQDRFRRDIKDFTETGDMSDDLYDALYDYYFDDMPYGTKKARTGDPHEWVADRFADDLGINENLISPMIMPVSEGSCNMTMEGSYCPEHGLAECGMYEQFLSEPIAPKSDPKPDVNFVTSPPVPPKFTNQTATGKVDYSIAPKLPKALGLGNKLDMDEGVNDPDYRGGYSNEFDELEDLLSKSGMSQEELMRQRFLASKYGLNTPADMSKLPALKKDAEAGYTARKAALDADLEKRNQQYIQDKLTDLEYQQDPVAFVKRRTQQLSPTAPTGPTAPTAPADVAAEPGVDYSLPRAKLGSSPSAKLPNFRPDPAADVPAPLDQTGTRNQTSSMFQQLAQLRNRTRGTMAETSNNDPINSNSAMTGSYYEGKETDIQEGDALLARIKSLALLR